MVKNVIFLIISLHGFVYSAFAMQDNNDKLWVKKAVVKTEQSSSQRSIQRTLNNNNNSNNHQRQNNLQKTPANRISTLVSALLNQDCSDHALTAELLWNDYTLEEIKNARIALQASQTGAYLTFDEVTAAIGNPNAVLTVLITALRKILNEQKLGHLSTRVKHPTDEMVIEWLQKYLYTPKLSEQSVDQVYEYYQNGSFIQKLRLFQTRDLGRYVFYNTQARLNGTYQECAELDQEYVEPQTQPKKRKFEFLNNNNNNQVTEKKPYHNKKIRTEKEEAASFKSTAEKIPCRFDGCNITATFGSNLKLHYLSSNHRACPYGNCDKTDVQRMNIAELKQHLHDAHSNESQEVYFCETCNFVGIIGSCSRRHEEGKKHKQLN
ncbi:hypothetical protein JST56_03175 [Candidatus Dependentiae bacterium]|nr:hypothetical protein [Candidatus Dependentiae bacterium]